MARQGSRFGGHWPRRAAWYSPAAGTKPSAWSYLRRPRAGCPRHCQRHLRRGRACDRWRHRLDFSQRRPGRSGPLSQSPARRRNGQQSWQCRLPQLLVLAARSDAAYGRAVVDLCKGIGARTSSLILHPCNARTLVEVRDRGAHFTRIHLSAVYEAHISNLTFCLLQCPPRPNQHTMLHSRISGRSAR